MDLEASITRAGARQIEYADRWLSTPLPDDAWGFFSYPDGPPALGGGQISTTWLENRNEALAFIADVLPFHPPGMASTEVAQRVRQVIDQMKSGDLNDQVGVHQLNEHLAGLSQITFFGSLQSLVSDNDVFCSSVRADFLDVAEGQAVPAVPAERLNEFKDWLLNYGI